MQGKGELHCFNLSVQPTVASLETPLLLGLHRASSHEICLFVPLGVLRPKVLRGEAFPELQTGMVKKMLYAPPWRQLLVSCCCDLCIHSKVLVILASRPCICPLALATNITSAPGKNEKGPKYCSPLVFL